MSINYWNELAGMTGVTELSDIDVDRADLVANPAIRRRFLMFKSDGDAREDTNTTQEDEMELIEVLKGLLAKAENADFAVEAVATLDLLQKSADEEGANGLLEDLQTAFGDSDTITKEQFEEWQTKAADLAVEKEEETPEPEIEVEDEEEEVAKSDDEEDEVEGEVIEKSLTEKIEKQAQELKLAKADFKKAQKEIETLRIEKQRKELVEKASSELCNLGKSADEVGDLLMSFRKAGVPEEVFDGLYDLLKSNSEMIKQSGFFNEFGTSIEPDDSDPEVKMMNEAKKLAKNGDFDSVPQAYAHLYKSAEKE